MEQKLSEQELVRRQKMEDLRAKGIDPFGHAFARTHRSAQLREEYGEVRQRNNLKSFFNMDVNNFLWIIAVPPAFPAAPGILLPAYNQRN